MKAFILFSLLSFASAILMIPSDGNMTVSESIHLHNSTKIDSNSSERHNNDHIDSQVNKHNTNYDNSRHRPHLAVIDTTSRKLMFSDESDSSDDTVESNGRKLLRRSSKASSPPPPPTPTVKKASPPPPPPTVKKASSPPPPPPPTVKKASPPPPPSPPAVKKASPPPPPPTPTVKKASPPPPPPTPTTTAKKESDKKASPPPPPPTPTTTAKKESDKKASPPPSEPAPRPRILTAKPESNTKSSTTDSTTNNNEPKVLVINKYASVDNNLSKKTKEIAKQFETEFASWVITTEGQDAIKFCQSLGISNKPDIYNGCIEDMRVTKSKSIAEESALSAEEFLSKEEANPSKQYCVASGDPHVTNYDGEFFHIQEPGIYTVARTPDNVFEIQEKMRKNGDIKPGVPSCMTGAVVHYKQMNIEVDVANFGKVLVNGKEVDLPEDFTLTFGGVQVRYGKQVVEWKGASIQPSGLKITTPNGFSVVISGGYCGVLETNVPTSFFGKMEGICGNADGVKSAADYANPNGVVLDVNYGAKKWEMGGYDGPDSLLSKWQLSWKPQGTECYFAKECETSIQTRKVVVTPAKKAASISEPVVAPVDSIRVTPTVSPKDTTDTKQTVVVVSPTEPKPEDKLLTKTTESTASKSSSHSKSHSQSDSHKVCHPEVFPTVSSTNIVHHVKSSSNQTIVKMNDLYNKFKTMTNDMKKSHLEQFAKEKKIVNDTETKAKDTYNKYYTEFTEAENIMIKINALNITLTHHHKILAEESDYLERLKLFKPKFMTSLDNVKKHVSGIKNDIHTTIVEGEDKNSLLSILEDVRDSTDKSANLLAKAFMDHYDKYDKKYDTNKHKYHEELDAMKFLRDKYKVDAAKRDGLWKEYSDILTIAKKLKESIVLSEDDEKTFDYLMVRIAKAFKANERLSSKNLSTPNTQCAADVLKAHIDHNRV